MSLINKIFGDLNSKEVKKIEKIVDQIESYDAAMEKLSDEELRAKTDEFRDRFRQGESLDAILPEAFAVCREGAVRSLGMKHFRVQLIGGVVLHQGRIAEMKTGEGKTLVATLAAYLNALEGKGVHVVTVNDYLAKRDAEWMGKLYTFLGLTVGCVTHDVEGEDRKKAYRADITYGTNNEFGFDYLRDNMVIYREELMQRDLHYAIIDEVDSILIDEARTPLIISGQGDKSTDLYSKADRFVRTLVPSTTDPQDKNTEPDNDFVINEKENEASLTDQGIKKAETFFGIENFGDPENMEINHHVLQALKANNLMERDVDYIVKDGEIVIVDEFTGRLMLGRRFSNGLHQAIEAKEHVRVRSESKTLATITLQNYFRMYDKIAGMTGTAKTEEDEFRDIYNMDVVVIPTNQPVARDDLHDVVYKTEKGKFKALVDKVAEIHQTGQPVLVGTISIEKSELISTMLTRRGIKHNVLNAKQHEREAEIVAEAGRKNTVTIATNMAGRGTDIILGGNPEFEAKKEMKKQGFTDEEISFASGFVKSDDTTLLTARARFHELLEAYKKDRQKEHVEVVDLGGLFIIGSERHESRRIDNQLRGRAGRQGDPGKTQFFISLEDDLMRLFGGERLQTAVGKLGMEDDDAIQAGMISRRIEAAQKKVEGRNFGIRKYVLQYDNVMNKQREIIYGERKKVLFGEDLHDDIMNMRNHLVDTLIEQTSMESKFPEEWNLVELNRNIHRIVPLYHGKTDFSSEEYRTMTRDSLGDLIKDRLDRIYEEIEKPVGPDRMRDIERMILLRVVDSLWMNHIDAMSQLKSGIGLRALGQQDPVAAYAKEGFDMFEELETEIQENTVRYCYGVTLSTGTERKAVISGGTASKSEYREEEAPSSSAGDRSASQAGMRSDGEKPITYKRTAPKVGRNDPCPCGSGKKYKNCCMKKEK